MSFPQKTVGRAYAIGVAGDKAALNPTSYTVAQCLAESDMAVGTFAFAGSAPEFAANAGSDLLGFVVRNLVYHAYGLGRDEQGSLVIGAGQAVTMATKGDFYAVTTTAPSVGQRIFASTTDGTLATGAAGATVAGHVETKWSVTDEADGVAGSLIVISA